MIVRPGRIALITLAAVFALASVSGAQAVQWGAKGGINSTSVKGLPYYYDSLYCCLPQTDAMVDATSATGFTAGGFVSLPIHAWFGVQPELLFSRKSHAVDFQPYGDVQATFTRDYVEAAALAKLEFPVTSLHRVYVAGGPVFGFKTGEHTESNDPLLVRGDPETDIYVLQATAYAAPELLKSSQVSVAVAGGWVYRRFLVEVRLTQGLQSIFKDREGLIAGFVAVGGHEPTVREVIIRQQAFLFESAKNRDVAVLAGFRF